MNYQELVEELTKAAAQIAADITIKTIEEQRQADAKAIKDRRIHNTKLLLRKYRLFNEHIGSATFKESQINLAMAIDFSQQMYDPNNRADQVVEGILNSTKKTKIILSHINSMLRVYEIYCNDSNSDQMLRRYDSLFGKYIADERVSYEDLAEKWNVDIRTIRRDIHAAENDFSVLLFGVDWLHSMTISCDNVQNVSLTCPFN